MNRQLGGDIGELQVLLQDALQKYFQDVGYLRTALRRVMHLMTVGMDLTDVFGSVIMCSQTKDLVSKKMVYHYISHYARTNPELAILAVNALQSDCRDSSPQIRGLALRTLSGLRLKDASEYVHPLIRTSLRDDSPYVRRSAVISTLKLYDCERDWNLSLSLSGEMEEMLMMREKNTDVIAALVYTLQELSEHTDKKFNCTADLAVALLNRIGEFNEWNQCYILRFLLSYAPVGNEEEVFAYLNVIDPLLRSTHTGVVMSALHYMVSLVTTALPSQNYSEIHRDVLQRVKRPLLTMSAMAPPEALYAILSHFRVIIRHTLFRPHVSAVFGNLETVRSVMVKEMDSLATMKLKLDIILQLCTEETVSFIIEELQYYSYANAYKGTLAISTLPRISHHYPSTRPRVMAVLLRYLDSDVAYQRTQALCALRDVLRHREVQSLSTGNNPNNFLDTPESTHSALSVLNSTLLKKKRFYFPPEPMGQESILFLLSAFPSAKNAPYILEHYTDRYDRLSRPVRRWLLSAAMYVWSGGRAPEMQHVLGALLEKSVSDVSDADVHDRALLYYRMLRENVTGAVKMFREKRLELLTSNNMFLEEEVPEDVDLLETFNTLHAIYGELQSPADVESDSEYDSDDDYEEEIVAPNFTHQPLASQAGNNNMDHGKGVVSREENLLPAMAEYGEQRMSGSGNDLMDLLSSAPAASQPPQDSKLSDDPVQFSPDAFQMQWGSLPMRHQSQSQTGNVLTSEDVVERLERIGFAFIASGTLGGEHFKGFAYGQEQGSGHSGTIHMLELIYILSDGTIIVKEKAAETARVSGEKLVEWIVKALS